MKKLLAITILTISFVFFGVKHPGRQPEAIPLAATVEAFHEMEPDTVDQVQEPPAPPKK